MDMKYSLERITTEFSPLEDRIKLLSQIGAESSIVILLTRRLLSLVLPTLIERVDSSAGAAPDSSAATAGEATQAVAYQRMRQEFAQIAANSQLVPLAPVKAVQDSVALLPFAVDFKATKRALILVFREDGGTMATLALEDVQLRQWLQILYKCAEREGGWQLPQWPAWLTGASYAKAPQGLAVH